MMGFCTTPSPEILFLLFDSCPKSTPTSASHQNANKQILMQQRIITHTYCQILTISFAQRELQKRSPVPIWSLTTQHRAHLRPDTATTGSGFPVLVFASPAGRGSPEQQHGGCGGRTHLKGLICCYY